MTNEKAQTAEVEKLMQDGAKEPACDIVEKSMGVMGRWQLWICFVVFLCKFPIAWQQLNIVLIAPPVEFSCVDNTTDKCSANCSSVVFDRSLFTNTILMQWNLICDRAALGNFAQTVTMLGILVGNCIFGIVSDKFGRRHPLVWAVIIQLISGTAAAFSPWFWMFLLFRFICAVATGGTMVTSFVLVMEIVGTKWRTPLCILYQLPFNLAHLSLSFIGYYLRDWQHIQLAVTLPSLILVSYYWIILESPRWLLATGQEEKAIQIMEKVARYNKLPHNSIKGDVDTYVNKRRIEQTTGKFLDLFRTPNIRIRTICIGFNWIVCGLCFFGGAQYMGQLGGNMFVNIALSALTQIPGTLSAIWFMQRFGRKHTLLCADLLAGVSFLLISVIPMESDWPRIFLGTMGMLGLSVSFPTVYVFSGELYPTVIRNIGVGTGSMFARIGSMLAPFVPGLGSVQSWLPSVIFGSIPIIGAFLSCYLPETLNCSLPETMEDAENFGNAKSKTITEQTEIQCNETRT